ncbi:LLM class flavin-dependent oxidoreductase [Microlunatus flavus]|uniref:Luciferase-like monooxygenase n=1 Tax=Microlunatus flavus TaxID=1036181 RepID=A0A1H9FV01_9ACTN|nr:LLM class flavin-dependent oxidoreductase [Microlunatus flavus]SEQ41725.1 Luciferase-like monooxygenase [Microlunatus flavus]
MDYRHPLSFGVSVEPSADALETAFQLADLADTAGLDLVAVQDHPYQSTHLDLWTLMTLLAARTRRVSVMSDVADLQLRPPTMLAKAAASLAVATGGRVRLGVGGGAFPDAIAHMGGTPRRGRQMVGYADESVQILRAALRGGRVRVESEHHHVDGYQAGPATPTPVPVLLGSQQPKMLAVTGRSADGWVSPLNVYVPPLEVAWRQEAIDEAARTEGREPAEISRTYNVIGALGAVPGAPGVVGGTDRWIDTLTSWALELGFDTFVFWPVLDHARQVAQFAAEVVPAVKQAVARERGLHD